MLNTDLIVSISAIWIFISFILFMLLLLDGSVEEFEEFIDKIRPMFKPVLVFITAIILLPMLIIMSAIIIAFAMTYPLHLIFVKKDYRKSLKEYTFHNLF
jgi:hypothetical protein